MSRSRTWRTAAAAVVAATSMVAAGCGSGAGSASAGGDRTLTFSYMAGEQTPIGELWDWWMDEVEQRTDGEITFDPYWDATPAGRHRDDRGPRRRARRRRAGPAHGLRGQVPAHQRGRAARSRAPTPRPCRRRWAPGQRRGEPPRRRVGLPRPRPPRLVDRRVERPGDPRPGPHRRGPQGAAAAGQRPRQPGPRRRRGQPHQRRAGRDLRLHGPRPGRRDLRHPLQLRRPAEVPGGRRLVHRPRHRGLDGQRAEHEPVDVGLAVRLPARRHRRGQRGGARQDRRDRAEAGTSPPARTSRRPGPRPRCSPRPSRRRSRRRAARTSSTPGRQEVSDAGGDADAFYDSYHDALATGESDHPGFETGVARCAEQQGQ